MSDMISGVTGAKFTKFLAVIIFLIDSVNSTVRVVIRPPVFESERRHIKKKLTSVKHKPVGIAMSPGNLTMK